jgi:hypothetical protein
MVRIKHKMTNAVLEEMLILENTIKSLLNAKVIQVLQHNVISANTLFLIEKHYRSLSGEACYFELMVMLFLYFLRWVYFQN